MALWKLSIMAYTVVKVLPLVKYYTVCMQLHGKTIVWLQWGVEYNAEEIMFQDISCLDRSKSSCVDRLWMSECNSERALRFHDRLQIMLRKLENTKNTVGVHCGEPYSQ